MEKTELRRAIQVGPILPRCLDHVVCPDRVSQNELTRTIDGTIHVRLGGQMHYGTGFMLGKYVVEFGYVAYVGIDKRIPGAFLKIFQGLQISGIGELIEINHLVVCVLQTPTNQVRSNKTSTACNENFHLASIKTFTEGNKVKKEKGNSGEFYFAFSSGLYFLLPVILRIFIVAIGVRTAVGAVKDQAHDLGLALIKKFQGHLRERRTGETAAVNEQNPVHFRGQRGGIVGGEHRAAIDDDAIEAGPDLAQESIETGQEEELAADEIVRAARDEIQGGYLR